MIIQEEVYVNIVAFNYEYWINKGYKILKNKNKWGKIGILRGTKILVQVSELPPQSNVKILCACDKCGKEKWIMYQDLIDKSGKYLCKYCAHQTDNFKEKLKQANLNKIMPQETKDKISKNSWMKGRNKENHPNWNPLITDIERKHKIPGMTKWCKEVLKRDNYTCQKCGYVGKPKNGIMIAHHINNFLNFKEQRTDIDNGITLCKECHYSKKGKGIHNIFGLLTTKQNLEEFIHNKPS